MKQIVKNFNNLVKKTIFKVQNKTNNNFRIISFNKLLLTTVSLLFFYLFYLLIPTFYEKTWVQNNIESKLFDEFKIRISASSNISYHILPAPHFYIKDSKILLGNLEKEKSIADIKNLKIFISQNNFFNKKKINLKEVVVDNVNFYLLRDNFILLNNASNNKLSNKKIKINNSNIFLKNNLGETITIIKIFKAALFFDNKKLLNLINSRGEVFNIPFSINFENQINLIKNKKINIEVFDLGISIFNKSNKNDNGSISGKNAISFLNSTINTKYNIKKNSVTFTSSNSKIDNSKLNYSGELSINPFDLNLNVDLGHHKISQLFKINPILNEFFKSGLLFNDNISLNSSIGAHTNIKDEIFQTAKINFHIINGKIDLNNTKFINNEIGSIEVKKSNFFFNNKNLILNADILIEVKSTDKLFSFLNTNKSSRKNFKTILINLDYDLLSNQIEFNNIIVDNKDFNEKLLRIIRGFEDNNLNNLNRSRRLINKMLETYEG